MKAGEVVCCGVVAIVTLAVLWSGSQPTPYSVDSTYKPRQQLSAYQQQLARHRELGEKLYPSQAELHEYLMLDARLSVREGQMSVSDFESWTGEEY